MVVPVRVKPEKREVRGRASLGPTFPIVGVGDFTKLKVKPGQLRDLWEVIGPTVELNMTKRVELWQIFTMCYVQGLENGAAIEREKHENSIGCGQHGEAGGKLGPARRPARPHGA